MKALIGPRRGVLFVTSLKEESWVKGLLEEHACKHWKVSPYVQLLVIPTHLFHEPGYLKSKIKKKALEQEDNIEFDVFIYGTDLLIDGFIDNKERWEVRYCGNIRLTFENKLRQSLRALQLDWLGGIAGELKNAWLRSEIDEKHVTTWVEQFESLGHHGWVGKKLLQSLDFWPESRVLKALDITEKGLEGFNHICLSTDKAGKSADILRNLIIKSLAPLHKDPSSIVKTPKECLDTALEGNVLWVEDSLLTGTEISSLINSLFGVTKPGRSPKTIPLSDRNNLLIKFIQFRFAVATDFGRAALESILKLHSVDNYDILEGQRELLLTPRGVAALSEGRFFSDETKKIIKNPYICLNLPAFSAHHIWNDIKERQTAIRFCRDIGKQLFKSYVQNKVATGVWSSMWSEERLAQSALGMNGFGLALAFAHTVPKASLPLIWGSGDVFLKRRNGKWKKKWQPLFPGTD